LPVDDESQRVAMAPGSMNASKKYRSFLDLQEKVVSPFGFFAMNYPGTHIFGQFGKRSL
jgi:hypothetical protein